MRGLQLQTFQYVQDPVRHPDVQQYSKQSFAVRLDMMYVFERAFGCFVTKLFIKEIHAEDV
jgi:hypothetical protein